MDENKTVDNSICCAAPPSAASQAAMKLRLMMDKVEGEDKCTLCKAAEELEKLSLNQSSGWFGSSWMLVIMLLMLSSGPVGDNAFDVDALKAYTDVIQKKAMESDCKLQNES